MSSCSSSGSPPPGYRNTTAMTFAMHALGTVRSGLPASTAIAAAATIGISGTSPPLLRALPDPSRSELTGAPNLEQAR